jgi:hypothetical protein
VVELESPADMTVGVLSTVEFEWSAVTSDVLGYPCTETPTTQAVRVYVEEISAEQLGWAAEQLLPTQMGKQMSAGGEPSRASVQLKVNTSYAWRVGVFNGYEESVSATFRFTTVERDCTVVECLNGGWCDAETVACVCSGTWEGVDCGKARRSLTGAVVGGVLGAAFFAAAVVLGVCGVVVLRRRRRRSRRVRLNAPGTDHRFGAVKVPSSVATDSAMLQATDQRIAADAPGFEIAVDVFSALQSSELEGTVKAVLYAYEKHGHGRALLKTLISREVARCTKPEVIFRHNCAATIMFKHYSKMVGLGFLFDTFSTQLEGLLQKEVDTQDLRQDVKDKKAYSLSVLDDTCEVDPTKLGDIGSGGDESSTISEADLLSVNALQLSLTVQRVLAQIFRTPRAVPAELRDICRHVRAEVHARYPEAATRAVGAFIFLRFFNAALAVPEAYGLLRAAPPPGVRRSLVLVTKIMTTLSAGAHFGKKEEFMAQFNDMVDSNRAKMQAYYDAVTAADSGSTAAEMKPVEVPPAIAESALAFVATRISKRQQQQASDKTATPAPRAVPMETQALVSREKEEDTAV